jgi:hypothetical protein
MATRDELLGALVVRYREAQRAEKGRILTEFVEVRLAAFRSNVSSSSVITTPAMRAPMRGIETRIARLRRSTGSAGDQGLEPTLDLGAGRLDRRDHRATARGVAFVEDCPRRVFAMAMSSVSWRRRVEGAFSARASGSGTG